MLPPSAIFTLLFVTLGPLKLLGPFAQRTRGLDEARLHQIAWRTFLIATASVILGSVLGHWLMAGWQVSVPALELAGGLIFFLVAVKQLMAQYEPPDPASEAPLPASTLMAAAQLVSPIVLTPYGIAAVIALLATSDSAVRTSGVVGITVLVMVLDLLAMWYVRRILAGFGMLVLQLLGAVLAVMQVAMSIQFIIRGLRDLHIMPDGG